MSMPSGGGASGRTGLSASQGVSASSRVAWHDAAASSMTPHTMAMEKRRPTSRFYPTLFEGPAVHRLDALTRLECRDQPLSRRLQDQPCRQVKPRLDRRDLHVLRVVRMGAESSQSKAFEHRGRTVERGEGGIGPAAGRLIVDSERPADFRVNP